MVDIDKLDEHSSLVKVVDYQSTIEQIDQIECCICFETDNLYKLPCSVDGSDHVLCGTCIQRIRQKNIVKCPYCTNTSCLY